MGNSYNQGSLIGGVDSNQDRDSAGSRSSRGISGVMNFIGNRIKGILAGEVVNKPS